MQEGGGGMLIGLLVFLAVGALCLGLGLEIWKKQKIDLIHAYHTRHVKPEDVPAYTKWMGLGLIAIGAGCVLTGVMVFLLECNSGWLALPAGFAGGFLLIAKAQRTWDGGKFIS